MRPEDLGFGRLFERVRDAVIVADAETQRIVLWNQAATKMFGYSLSEALELRVEVLVPDSLKAQHRAGMGRYAKKGQGPYIDSYELLDLPALRKDGEEIRIELSLSPIGPVDDAYGGLRRFVLAIVRDATERKRAEDTNSRLAAIVESVRRRHAQQDTRWHHNELEQRRPKDLWLLGGGGAGQTHIHPGPARTFR